MTSFFTKYLGIKSETLVFISILQFKIKINVAISGKKIKYSKKD